MGAKGALTGNRCTVDEPVTVLPPTLVRANGTRVDHGDRVVSVESDG